jgi:hypothetical protein
MYSELAGCTSAPPFIDDKINRIFDEIRASFDKMVNILSSLLARHRQECIGDSTMLCQNRVF